MDKNALTEKRRETVIGLLKGMNIKKASGEGFDKDDVYECMQQLCDLYEKNIEELEDGMIIKGKSKLNGGKIKTFKDHRIAMAFSTLNLISDEKIKLDNEDCINVSFPGYFDLIKSLTK